MTATRDGTRLAVEFAGLAVADFLAGAAFVTTVFAGAVFAGVGFAAVDDFDRTFGAGTLAGFAAAFDGDGFAATLA